MSAPNTFLQDICDSDTYDEWQRQLIDCFSEEEEKDELIRSLRAHLDDRYGSLDSEELEALKKEVVSSLVATAAQEAERPEPDASPAPAHEPDQWSSPSDLEVSWSLLDVMRAPTQQADEDESEAALILKDGLQRALTVLVCTFLADAVRLDEIPPRLTSYFASGLVQPTPGKLLDRLRWAASRPFSDTLDPLQAYIDEHEKSEDGWFAQLVRRRNEWAHPEDHDVDDVLRQTRELLSSPPSFVSADVMGVSSHTLCWIGTTTDPLPLSPLIGHSGGDLYIPEALDPPSTLQFAPSSPESLNVQERFESAWHELRVADPELADPSPEEFRAKARQAEFELSAKMEPGRLSSFPGSEAPGLLATPAIRDEVASAFRGNETPWICLSVSLSPGLSLSDALAKLLDLRSPPSFADLCSFQAPEHPYALLVDLSEVESEDALQALYWLADLEEECSPEHLRVVLLRGGDQVESDQDDLWDRLPSHLDELLYAPTMNPGMRLPDVLWTQKALLPWYKRLLHTLTS